MKVFGTIAKIIAALAAVIGAVYLIATYGSQIVEWSKKMLGICKGYYEEARGKVCCCGGESACDEVCCCDQDCQEEADAEAEAADGETADEADFAD